MPPSPPSTPLPSPPSDPFAAAAAEASPTSPASAQLPPPSYTYSDPYAPPPSNSYFDPLAPSSSSSSQPAVFDFSSVLTDDGYPSLTYSDLNNLGFPENYQLYSANTNTNTNNFLSHPNHQSNYQPYAAGNTALSLENNQLYAANSFFFSPENSQPYAANTTLSHENSQPYAAGNTSIILSHEYHANDSLSPDSDDDDEADDAGNDGNYFPLPYQHLPLPYNWRETLPLGVKFRPTDGELIVCYLEPHIRSGATPPGGPVTTDRDVYDYEPHQLLELGEDHGDGRRYFITPAKKIGSLKTDRIITTKTGFWKPSQPPKPVFFGTKYGYKEVGEKRPLAFYIETSEKEKKKFVKTQWLMQELKLPKNDDAAASSSSSSSSKHHLEFVVAIVYYCHRRQR